MKDKEKKKSFFDALGEKLSSMSGARKNVKRADGERKENKFIDKDKMKKFKFGRK